MFMWAAKKFLGCNLLDSRSLLKNSLFLRFCLHRKLNWVCSMYFPGSHQNQYCYFRLMYSEKTNQKRLASNHNKNDRSIDRHIWPKYGIPLPLWLYISSASSDRKSHTVMLSGYSLQVVYVLYRGTVWVQSYNGCPRSSLYIKWSNISWYSSYQWLMFVFLFLLVGHFESSSPSVELTRKKFQWQSWNCLHLWSPNMHRSLGFQVFHISKQFLGLSLVLILIKFPIGWEQI
jgi:hypothetical protein